MEKHSTKSRREIHARWMLNNQSLDQRQRYLGEYLERHGPVATIELKQALVQENHRLAGMDDHEKDKQLKADELSQQEVLHG